MINYFISSTFKDMHAERDLVNSTVYPEFRKVVRTHGEDATVRDLRWGLDNFNLSEEEASRKVIGICLDGLTRSHFIAFLGDRYGWIPPRVDYIPEKFSEMLGNVAGKSITNLEIDYGLRNEISARHCIICIRRINGDVPRDVFNDYFETDMAVADTLKKFKDTLRRDYPNNVIEYTAEWQGNGLGNFMTTDGRNLGDVLFSRMCNACEAELKEFERQPWQVREWIAAYRQANRRAESFYGRAELTAAIQDKLDRNRIVFLRGAHGSGKSSTLSKVSVELRASGKQVCCLFAGSSVNSVSAQQIVEQMTFYVEEVLGKPHYSPPEGEFRPYIAWKLHLDELCQQLTEAVYFIIDAVDQLAADAHRDALDFIPVGNARCLVSFADDFELPQMYVDPIAMLNKIIPILDDADIDEILREFLNHDELSMSETEREEFIREMLPLIRMMPELLDEVEIDKDFCHVDLPLLEESEVGEVLSKIMERHGKALFDETKAKVLEKASASNPLFLEMTAQFLNMISSRELLVLEEPQNIVNTTVDFVDKLPDDTAAAAMRIIIEAIDRLCDNESSEVVLHSIGLLGVSRHGLRFNDIKAFFDEESLTLYFERLKNYLGVFFYEDSAGKIDFSHLLIRQGIRDAMSEEYFKAVENKLADYIASLPPDDSLRLSEGFYYAQKTRRYDFAVELLDAAVKTRNPMLLQDIYLAFLSDKGEFGVELLKSHLDADKFDKCVDFFFGPFSNMLSNSADEFEIARCLIKALAETPFGVKKHYFDFDMAQARHEFWLNKYDDAELRCLSIVNWGEAFADTIRDDFNACRSVAGAYISLSVVKGYSGDEKMMQEYSNLSSKWLEKIPPSEQNYLDKLCGLINAIMSTLGLNDDSEDRLRIFENKYNAALSIYRTNPTSPANLNALASNAGFIALENVKLGRIEIALVYAKQSDTYAQQHMRICGGDLTSMMSASFAKMVLSIVERNTGDLKSAFDHISISRDLINKVHALNPTEATENMMNTVEEVYYDILVDLISKT